MTAVYTVTDACTACGACLLTCPAHALLPTVPLQVRADRCTDCGECVEVCPADAVVRVEAPAAAAAPAAAPVPLVFPWLPPGAACRAHSSEDRPAGRPPGAAR